MGRNKQTDMVKRTKKKYVYIYYEAICVDFGMLEGKQHNSSALQYFGDV